MAPLLVLALLSAIAETQTHDDDYGKETHRGPFPIPEHTNAREEWECLEPFGPCEIRGASSFLESHGGNSTGLGIPSGLERFSPYGQGIAKIQAKASFARPCYKRANQSSEGVVLPYQECHKHNHGPPTVRQTFTTYGDAHAIEFPQSPLYWLVSLWNHARVPTNPLLESLGIPIFSFGSPRDPGSLGSLPILCWNP